MRCYATCPECRYRPDGRDIVVWCDLMQQEVARVAEDDAANPKPIDATCIVPAERRPELRARINLTIFVLKAMLDELAKGEAATLATKEAV